MRKILLIIITFTLLPYGVFATPKPVSRVLIALYDSRQEPVPQETTVHYFLEMPANHLGYDIQYYDVTKPLPTLDDNVAGIILWFNSGTQVPNIPYYLTWLKKAVAEKKKLLIIENGGLGDGSVHSPDIMRRWNDVLKYIGVHDDGGWNAITYQAKISYIDKSMVGFEREIKPPFSAFSGYHILSGSQSLSHLRMLLRDTDHDNNFDMVVTSRNGGLIASGYAIYAEEKIEDGKEKVIRAWLINPFAFLQQSLGASILPIPDTTTLDGKRIFYSQIDGDGWNNITEIEKYRGLNTLSSEVIYKEIFKPYSDFAFNASLITADVDPECFAAPDSERVAREIFALPNIEPSSHTYSHPFFWGFFADYTPEKEKPLLGNYPIRPSQKFSAWEIFKRKIFENRQQASHQDHFSSPGHDMGNTGKLTATTLKHRPRTAEEELAEYHNMPRAYACSPFNLEQEILGAIKTVKSLSPPGKTVRLIQWPGDTDPFEPALEMAHKAGLLNINGGDSRFDNEFPSYSFVAPIGVKAEDYHQIYASNSNEETYTDDWHDRFYGFRYLQATVQNTESPIRISPFDIYFHMFSGQKEASLNAVKENLEYARKQDIIPITASDYASIAEGFYSTEITQASPLSWHIRNRGDLATVRFDNPGGMTVDFGRSKGVLGQYAYQNSLYVALDPSASDAYIALYKIKHGILAHDHEIYLLKSRWRVTNLQRSKKAVEFEAGGYGTGNMIWHVAPNSLYMVDMTRNGISSETQIKSTDKGLLNMSIRNDSTNQPVTIIIRNSI